MAAVGWTFHLDTDASSVSTGDPLSNLQKYKNPSVSIQSTTTSNDIAKSSSKITGEMIVTELCLAL